MCAGDLEQPAPVNLGLCSIIINHSALYCTQWRTKHTITEGKKFLFITVILVRAQPGEVSTFCRYKFFFFCHNFLGGYTSIPSFFSLSHPPKWLHPSADISYVHKVCVCYEHISQGSLCVVVGLLAILSLSLPAVITSPISGHSQR